MPTWPMSSQRCSMMRDERNIDPDTAHPARAERMSALPALARRALALAGEKNLTVVTAESCTAGKLSALLSEAPGASELLHGGFVTYNKASKTRVLGIPAEMLLKKGAVCREVAAAMARGALIYSPADVAVSITGVAGPDPDEDGNAVGRVCIGIARGGAGREQEYNYGKLGREAIQERAMADALDLLLAALQTA